MGSLACGLVGLAGWGFVSRKTGLWAAGILAVYPPAIFFDGLIQKTSLGQLLGALLLVLLAWTARSPARPRPLLVGIVLGMYALTRENALALVPVVALWLWLGFREQSVQRRCQRIGLLLAGTAVVLLPVGARNFSLGGTFALTTFQMGPNFYIGNNADATGRYQPLVKGHATPEFERSDATELAQRAVGRELSPREVSDYWMAQAWRFIQAEPVRWLGLVGLKWLLVWNAYEVPDAESYYVYCEWSWLLGTSGSLFHFGLLVPLAVGGLVLTWKDRSRVWLLYAMLLVMAGAVALFYVFARYRYPLVPVLAIFAGAAVAEGVIAWRQAAFRQLATAAALAVGAAVVCNLPLNPERELNAMAWGNLGGTLARQGRIDQAVVFFERAVEGAPDAAEARYNLGLAYSQQERWSEAVEQLRAASRLDATLIEVDYQLGYALERLGQLEEALHYYKRALRRDPGDTQSRAAIERLRN
jgi:tetratricopeptide (TPR) repeat protein